MVKELVIHLGDCKTGTTALQSVLAEKRYSLPNGSIHYPAPFNDIPLARTLSYLPRDAGERRFREARFSRLATAMEESDAQWGIISAEHFEFVDPSLLKETLNQFLPGYRNRLRLIAYVRPHHERIISAYAEAVKKTGERMSMGAFFQSRHDNPNFDYHRRFTAWRSAFGDRFTLRPFIRDRLVSGDITADFFQFVTGGAEVELRPGTLNNKALPVEDLALMREVHARIRQQHKEAAQKLHGARLQLGWNFAPFLANRDREGATKLQMDRDLCKKVADAFRANAIALDADFFDGTPMSSALEAAAERSIAAPQSLAIQDHFNPSEISLIRAWADFTGRVMAADPDHFMWASKPSNERRENYIVPTKDIFGRFSTSILLTRLRMRLRGLWR